MMQLDKRDRRVGDADVSEELAEACAFWQVERANSSLLRAGARAETGIPHYFQADFIDGLDAAARAQPLARRYASTLLCAMDASTARTADGWCAEVGLPATGFAGRGLAPKPKEDEQILATLTRERAITMPLWGVSLNPDVAQSYGGTTPRWIFEIVGEFPAVPAWVHSGIKDDEQELICGGRYSVLEMVDEGPTTRVRLSAMTATVEQSMLGRSGLEI